jgi:hypothetical protein
MAAAIIPILTAVGPSLISLIAGLVHRSAPAAEQQLGPGTGPVKFAQVFGDVIAALNRAASAGQIDKLLPSDQEIQLIIQSVVSSMKLAGLLSASQAADISQAISTPAPAGQQGIILTAGQSLTITVR